MGASFSSDALSGGVVSGTPFASYAYEPSNTDFFGADATFYEFLTGGEVTPYLIQPEAAAPTLTCSPILGVIFPTGTPPPQTLACPISGISMAPGLYTLSFSQYTSTFVSTDDTGYPVYTKADEPNTLTALGQDQTYSFVAPITPGTTTTTITPVLSATTTITSGK